MRYLCLGLFAFFGLLFTWSPAFAQCSNGRCAVPIAISQPAQPAGVLSADESTYTSADGKTYHRHPDGVYREEPVRRLYTKEKRPGCCCYPCECNK